MSMARLGKTLLIATLLATASLCKAEIPQVDAAPGAASPDSTPVDEEIVVRGFSYGELRAQIRLAQEAVYARFNDINSDDAFDITCKDETRVASHIKQQSCVSNSWREQNANMARATVAQMRGEYDVGPAMYRGIQLLMQKRLADEMRRLAVLDPQLGEAVLQLGRAMYLMNLKSGERPNWTLYRELSAGDDGLPFGAERVVQVRMGIEPWTHLLKQSTFTLGQVAGDIRKLELECADLKRSLDYVPNIEWTVPAGATDCTVRVSAKRGATFALYEFQ
jgi:hypothetical protein